MVGALFLLRPPASETTKKRDPEDANLAPGRYLIKAHVDSQHRLAEDPTSLLGDGDLFGQVEIRARWGIGFREAERIAAELFKSARKGKATAATK